MQQLRKKGCVKFTDAFNYIDLISLVLMMAMVTWTVTNSLSGGTENENYEVAVIRDYIQSVNAVLMWYKFAYLMRSRDNTGWFIRMIAEVVYDMGPFLLVLLLSLMAFTDAFSSMSIAQ